MRDTHVPRGRCAARSRSAWRARTGGRSSDAPAAAAAGCVRSHAQDLQGQLPAQLRVAVARAGRQHPQDHRHAACRRRDGDLPRQLRQGRRHTSRCARQRAGQSPGAARRALRTDPLVTADRRSPPTKPVAILPPPTARGQSQAHAGARPARRRAGLETGTSRTKAYVGAARGHLLLPVCGAPPRATSSSCAPATARRSSPGPPRRGPGRVRSSSGTAAWRAPATPGRYSFRLTRRRRRRCARHRPGQDFKRDAFDLYDHMFPVRGRHDYGGAGATSAPAARATATRART